MDALKKEECYTVDDIYALSDGQRAELIDGKIYYMAPPSRQHQDIIFMLSRKIADYIDGKKGDCKIYLAPFAVFLNADDKNYVEPDISVICDKNKLTDKGCNGAPDWIIEVVSPSSYQTDYYKKLFKYLTAGVLEYWIVDPMEKCVTVYSFTREDVGKYNFSDKIRPAVYEDLEIDFSEVNVE